MALTIVGKGNFAGERPITLTIGKKNVQVPMDKVKVTEVPKKVPWDAKKAAEDQGITLTGFVVRNGRTILKEGEDFKVRYANNKEAGTAMSSVEVNNIPKEGYPYTGKPIEPMSLGNITVTLKKGGDVPKEALIGADGKGIVTISVKDKVESQKKNGWKQSFKVLDESAMPSFRL